MRTFAIFLALIFAAAPCLGSDKPAKKKKSGSSSSLNVTHRSKTKTWYGTKTTTRKVKLW